MGSNEFWARVGPLHETRRPRCSIAQFMNGSHKLIVERGKYLGTRKCRTLLDGAITVPRKYLRGNIEPRQTPQGGFLFALWQNQHERAVPSMGQPVGQAEVNVALILIRAGDHQQRVVVSEPAEPLR